MLYDGLAIGTVIMGVLVLLISMKILFNKDWFLGWLKGMFGLTLTTVAIVLALSAWDIFSYRQVLNEKSIATISFQQLEPQYFEVTLVDNDGHQRSYQLKGDQWQLDARIIQWQGFMADAGLKPGFRLDRLSGRYYSLDQERNDERTVFKINSGQSPIDLWSMLRESSLGASIVHAVYGSAAYIPMQDGALFEITLSQSGLVAKPLNDTAKSSISNLQ